MTDRVARLQEGWMDSPGHRRNILLPGLDRFGFGIAGNSEVLYSAQTFAGPWLPRGAEGGERPARLPPRGRDGDGARGDQRSPRAGRRRRTPGQSRAGPGRAGAAAAARRRRRRTRPRGRPPGGDPGRAAVRLAGRLGGARVLRRVRRGAGGGRRPVLPGAVARRPGLPPHAARSADDASRLRARGQRRGRQDGAGHAGRPAIGVVASSSTRRSSPGASGSVAHA